jgi:hypothetical protein
MLKLPTGFKADIFSIGAVMYFLMHLERFNGSSSFYRYKSLLNKEVVEKLV